jgi:chromosomal replication initiation ATPase DnaA
MRYSSLENVIISGVSTITGVAITDMMSNSKKKEVALAKSVACAVFNDYGYGVREIGRLLNIDHKGVAVYVGSHDNRMADKKYLIKYNKVKAFVEGYESSNEVNLNRLNEMAMKVVAMEERYEHLKELLTSN